MADAPTPVPSTPAPLLVRPVEVGADRAAAGDAHSPRVVTGEVTQVLRETRPYRLEVAVPPPRPGVSSTLVALLSAEPYPPGTTLRLRVLGPASDVPYRILDALSGASTPNPSDVVRGSTTDRLLHAFREAGVANVVDRVRFAEAAVRANDGPLPLRIAVATELAARGLPVTADTVRGGVSLRTGALERPVEVGARGLIDLLRQHVDRSPTRTTLLRSIGEYVSAVRHANPTSATAAVTVHPATASSPAEWIGRAVEVVDAAFRTLTKGDAEYAAITRVSTTLREGTAPTQGPILSGGNAAGSRGTNFERIVDQLLLRHLPPSSEEASALTRATLRDLSPAARAHAIEIFTRLEREHLERQPWLPEFRAASRELLGRAEALQYLQWIEVGSLEPDTLFSGHGAWVDPEGSLPFRLAVRDARDEDGAGLGFRVVVESRRIGRVEVDGRLFEAEASHDSAEERSLVLRWRADEEETAEIMTEDVELWASALREAGFVPDIRPELRRSTTEVAGPVRGLDLQV